MTGLAIAGIVWGALFTVAGAGLLGRRAVLLGWIRAFPRSTRPAQILSVVALGWFGVLLYRSPLGSFDVFKPALVVVIPMVIFLVCRYMDELLAPRALGGLLILVPAPMLDAQRWQDTSWRLVMVLLAYALVLSGIMLLFSPYLFRKVCAVLFATDARVKAVGVTSLACGLGLLALGLLVY